LAAELLLKIGITVSATDGPAVHAAAGARWPACRAAVMEHVRPESCQRDPGCDFFVAVTATFRLVYVFLILEIGTRRILHWNTTDQPNAEWPMQQFQSCLTGEERYRFVMHDRDAIYHRRLTAPYGSWIFAR
jgi:putative transposase